MYKHKKQQTQQRLCNYLFRRFNKNFVRSSSKTARQIL